MPPQVWRGGLELPASSRVRVGVANTRLGHALALGAVQLSGFARIDKLFGRNSAGSVVVDGDEGNSRFLAPAPRRSGLSGLSAVMGL